MKIIVPTKNINLTSSTIAEPESPEVLWNAGTAYTIGNEVVRTETHKKYKRLVAGTTSTPPENDPTNWLEIGPTNRWAMFDDKIGTQSSKSTNITVVIATEGVGGLYLGDVTARDVTVTLQSSSGGPVVYQKDIELDGTIITSFYEWFFTPYETQTSVTLTDLPYHFSSAVMTIEMTGTGVVSCGVCKFGPIYEIGYTQYGSNSGIIDYSRKDVDDFGNYYIVERSFAKRASFDIFTNKSDYVKISKILSSIRATPAVYIGTEYLGYDPITIYGFYKDFNINIGYPTMHHCTLDVEGLI